MKEDYFEFPPGKTLTGRIAPCYNSGERAAKRVSPPMVSGYRHFATHPPRRVNLAESFPIQHVPSALLRSAWLVPGRLTIDPAATRTPGRRLPGDPADASTTAGSEPHTLWIPRRDRDRPGAGT